MKQIKKLILKEIEIYEKVCDCCGSVIDPKRPNSYDFNLEIVTGLTFPDDCTGEITTLDSCEDCSKDLIKILESNGFKFQVKERN